MNPTNQQKLTTAVASLTEHAQDGIEAIAKWIAAVATIALSVALGIGLFVWYTAHRVENDLRQIQLPAYVTTTTTTNTGGN